MEKLLQYAWQHRLWDNPEMTTTGGQHLEVLDPGWINTASGPDFFNSKLILDGQQWAGNVEIHINASDWFRHGHQDDKAYDSVILHVVSKDDTTVIRADGSVIPQVVFKPRASLQELTLKVRDWKGDGLICSDDIKEIDRLYITDLLDSLAYERLYSKAERFAGYKDLSDGDYEQALFISLARALGFGLNNDSLEKVALSVPLSVFRKHSDSLMTLEAILLGQAGLIPEQEAELLREYDFMKAKFSLSPVKNLNWKMSGSRPANLPDRRLRLLARILFGGFNKMGELTGCRSTAEIASRLLPEDSGLSESSVNSLIINAVIPAIFCYATERNDEQLIESMTELLHTIPAEKNRICRLFGNAGIPIPSAYHSQALIELRTKFCMQRKCIYCRIGNRILRKKG